MVTEIVTNTKAKDQKVLTDEEIQIEWKKCHDHCAYFIIKYIKIYDSVQGNWIDFDLWPAQEQVLEDIVDNLWVTILKARQLGLTWLCLAVGLWLAIFYPISIILIFSKRDDEAKYLLSDERLKGMYKRLPEWLKAKAVLRDSTHQFSLSNGSVFYGFPTTAGDSYTASLVIVDEADLVPDLGALMRAVKPTIDAGNRIILLSRADKDNPKSVFKNIYRSARLKKNKWHASFLPWHARLDRDQQWYEDQKQDIVTRTGYLDDLYEQYPSTEAEALSGSTRNKRIPPAWLEKCYDPVEPLSLELIPDAPAIPELLIYKVPEPGLNYVLGGDTAEGNPNSNDSSCNVLCKETGEQVALFSGKHEPGIFADYMNQLGLYYNKAPVMIERNHHGGTAIAWFESNASVDLLEGPDGKYGWLSNRPGKVSLYDDLAEATKNDWVDIHDDGSFNQLRSIEGNTLKAPKHEPDDKADAFALSFKGLLKDGSFSGLRQAHIAWNYRDLNELTDRRSVQQHNRKNSQHRITKRRARNRYRRGI